MIAAMPATAVIGLQWGDEGKGKIVDFLAHDADFVVRFNGGDNAGHAVKVDGRRFGLQLVPSSIFHPKAAKVIAAGTVINPQTLLDEVDAIESAGFSLKNLVISDRAHVIMPWHLEADRAAGAKTMRKGIGPAYADKALRFNAIRVGDLLHPLRVDKETGRVLKAFVGRFRRQIKDTTRLLNDALDRGRRVLLEGAQGTLLDVDHGTYPYVTASSTIAGGACTGAGLAPSRINRVVGVVKAYMTRVGAGPFPTEAGAKDADLLRKRGLEFGAATGMLRRCGWLDLVALEYAILLNRPDTLALTKLDVVETLDTVPVCVRYRGGKPVYESVVPKRLVAFLEKRLKTHVGILSFGAERKDTMVRL
jgi:adenylosuccinate synthase